MSEWRWMPNWYARRLHAVPGHHPTVNGVGEYRAACGAYAAPARSSAQRKWNEGLMRKSPPRCAHCVKIVEGEDATG